MLATPGRFDQCAFAVNQPGALTALYVYVEQLGSTVRPITIGVWRRAVLSNDPPQPISDYQLVYEPQVLHNGTRIVDSNGGGESTPPPVALAVGDRIALAFSVPPEGSGVALGAISASIRI